MMSFPAQVLVPLAAWLSLIVLLPRAAVALGDSSENLLERQLTQSDLFLDDFVPSEYVHYVSPKLLHTLHRKRRLRRPRRLPREASEARRYRREASEARIFKREASKVRRFRREAAELLRLKRDVDSDSIRLLSDAESAEKDDGAKGEQETVDER